VTGSGFKLGLTGCGFVSVGFTGLFYGFIGMKLGLTGSFGWLGGS
jgi:hypothetical protein